MPAEIHRHSTAAEAAESCAGRIVDRLRTTLASASRATLAVSGGTAVKLLFPPLAASGLPWDRIHVFWVDERAVPPDHEQSNYRLAAELLLQPAGIPARNVHRIEAELEPRIAASRYSGHIREFFGLSVAELPEFDVIHQGMGPDGHTASLFPGEPLIEDRAGLAAAVYSEKMSQWRITLLPGVLLTAKATVYFVTGKDKAPALRAVLQGRYDPSEYPSQISAHHGRNVSWYLDEASASLLDT